MTKGKWSFYVDDIEGQIYVDIGVQIWEIMVWCWLKPVWCEIWQKSYEVAPQVSCQIKIHSYDGCIWLASLCCDGRDSGGGGDEGENGDGGSVGVIVGGCCDDEDGDGGDAAVDDENGEGGGDTNWRRLCLMWNMAEAEAEPRGAKVGLEFNLIWGGGDTVEYSEIQFDWYEISPRTHLNITLYVHQWN